MCCGFDGNWFGGFFLMIAVGGCGGLIVAAGSGEDVEGIDVGSSVSFCHLLCRLYFHLLVPRILTNMS